MIINLPFDLLMDKGKIYFLHKTLHPARPGLLQNEILQAII